MRGPKPGNEMAYIHAMTMRAHHRTSERIGTLMVCGFGFAAIVNGVLWIGSGSIWSGLSALAALLGIILGVWTHIHHGTKADQWDAALQVLEGTARDRTILHHAPRRY